MGQRVRCITISMRRVSDLGVDNFLHPANTLCSQKEEILRIFDKTLFLGAKRTTSRGAKRRVRFEKEIYAHTCTRSVTTEAKRGHEKRTSGECAAKKNRTLTPAHTCDRVKIVRAESAPQKTNRVMRMHRRCIRTIHAPFGCM